MDTDDSIYLTEFTKRVNEFLHQDVHLKDIDTAEIENDILSNTGIVPGSMRKEVRRRGRKVQKSRTYAGRQVRRGIAKKWGVAVDSLDQCLVIADLTHARLVQTVFANGDTLRAKDPRPIPDMVTGAYVKCLHLLSLYGKSCGIATEILYLLREGFPDGAMSRLRTLYEHLVIMMLLLGDHTYELSEGYQDSAVFERLKQLKADKISLADGFWRESDTTLDELAEEIAELEELADEIISRRGSKIRKQYEWARPVLPESKKNNVNYSIKFTDLEEVAGADFLRRYYMQGNDSIHAGACAVINHFDFGDPEISLIRQRRDDWTIHFIGSGLPVFIGWATRAACKGIAWETEEYDELLYVCEVQASADAAVNAFSEISLIRQL